MPRLLAFTLHKRLCHKHPRGYNIGVRLVDEFLAKAKVSKHKDIRRLDYLE